jgi:hypothetical protein
MHEHVELCTFKAHFNNLLAKAHEDYGKVILNEVLVDNHCNYINFMVNGSK